MKKLLAVILVALLSSVALGQPTVGVFFSQDGPYDDAATNFDVTPNAPFNAYIVALGAESIESLSAYELGLTLPAGAFTLSVTGPNGWTNFGSATNHLVGFGAGGAGFPMPGTDGTVVLCTIQMLTGSTDAATIELGPADPPSDPGWGGALLVPTEDVNNPVRATTAGGEENGIVATLNSDGITPVESQTLSGVKTLFR